MLDRLLGPLARRWRFVAVALAVQHRYSDRQGGTFSASVALSGFETLLPLLLLATAALGFLDHHGNTLAATIVSRLGLTGSAARLVESSVDAARASRTATSVIGVLGLLWTSIGLSGTLQSTLHWMHEAPSVGWKSRLHGLGWLAGAAVLLIVSLAATGAAAELPHSLAWLGVLLGVVVGPVFDFALWLWTLAWLLRRGLGWRDHLLPALVGAIGFELLSVVGLVYVPHLVTEASSLYGSVGVILALAGWIGLQSKLFVYVAAFDAEHVGAFRAGEHEASEDDGNAERPALTPDAAPERAERTRVPAQAQVATSPPSQGG